VLVRRALAKTDLLLKALLNRLRPDSNSEWAEFGVVVTLSNGLLEIIRRGTFTSKGRMVN
jgi:hypothetical protein